MEYSSLLLQQASLERELTCRIGSHSVACYLEEVTFLPLPQPIKAIKCRT